MGRRLRAVCPSRPPSRRRLGCRRRRPRPLVDHKDRHAADPHQHLCGLTGLRRAPRPATSTRASAPPAALGLAAAVAALGLAAFTSLPVALFALALGTAFTLATATAGGRAIAGGGSGENEHLNCDAAQVVGRLIS